MSPRQLWSIYGQMPRDKMLGKLQMAGAYQLAHASEEIWAEYVKDL